MCHIFWKLTKKTSERSLRRHPGVLIIYTEKISHIALVFSLPNLNKYMGLRLIWLKIHYTHIYIYSFQQDINFISKSFRQCLYQLHIYYISIIYLFKAY